MNNDFEKYGPVRLCCGQRHFGLQCPDGKVMCCLCFGRFNIEELSTDKESGKKQDLCLSCDAKEQEALRLLEAKKGKEGEASSNVGEGN